VYSAYNALLENGWRMQDIDAMDMLGYFRLRAWSAARKRKKKEPRHSTIDQVWPGLKP
jgi:hypothetical protein